MSITSRDIRDAKLLGRTKYKIVRRKVEADMKRDDIELIKAMAWKEMTSDPLLFAELSKRVNPETIATLQKKYGG